MLGRVLRCGGWQRARGARVRPTSFDAPGRKKEVRGTALFPESTSSRKRGRAERLARSPGPGRGSRSDRR